MIALFESTPKTLLVPRDYQRTDEDESFRLWDEGVRGVLTRIFTGGGKTPGAVMKMRRWLERSDNAYCMVISYERDLVWQFAQEIYDFLGISPGIEMGDDAINPSEMPRVIVASRASLLPHKGITPTQVKDLYEHGITDVEWLSERNAKRILKFLASNNSDDDLAQAEVERLREIPEAHGGWSRVRKFDWQKDWLLFFDEAHRHVHSLKSVGHIVDYFDQNPNSRRSGMTATPKRGDGISIGHTMFPGVSIDYPLYHLTRPSAVRQGWAVPYVQKYIEVEGVDFKSIKQIAGDFDEADLERILGEEGILAKLIEPLLDLCGDRRTLIFSPGVEMAKNVAAYINARVKAECPSCHVRKWYPVQLISSDHGAQCPCGTMLGHDRVFQYGEQARSLNGETPERDRKQTYRAHQSGAFQFLSVCGLCREGYNDPDIACVAIFRPVSKKASSLAEQMKGRGCRPCREDVPILNEMLTAEERVEHIANGPKPNCLIVDLVGVTGLADCASTVQIYAEGLDDDVAQLAEKILAAEEGSVEEAIEKAKTEVEEARAKAKAEREEEERQRKEKAALRAKAQAEVKYSEHEVGAGSNTEDRASDAMYRLMRFLGMDIKTNISRGKAGRIINQLKQRIPADKVAYQNGLVDDQWDREQPSKNQRWRLQQLNVNASKIVTPWDASQLIGASMNPSEFVEKKLTEIRGVANHEILSGIGKDVQLAKQVLPAADYERLVLAGKMKRAALVKP